MNEHFRMQMKHVSRNGSDHAASRSLIRCLVDEPPPGSQSEAVIRLGFVPSIVLIDPEMAYILRQV